MEKVVGRILRSSEVKLEGQVTLQMKQLQSQAQPSSQKTAKQPVAAEIVENHPEFAVIQITCCCGEKVHLRCEYPSPEAGSPEPKESESTGDG